MSRVYGLGSTGVVLASVLALAVFASGDAFAQTNPNATITPPDNTAVDDPEVLAPADAGTATIQNVVVTPYRDRITVSWDYLADHAKYRVVITETGTKERAANLKTSFNDHTFSLKPDTEYRIAVSALEDKSTKTVTTTSTLAAVTDSSGNGAAAAQIQNVRVTPYYDRITVSWDRVVGDTKYRVALTDVETKEKAAILKTASNEHTFGLEPDTEYRIVVSALDDKDTKIVIKESTLAAVTDNVDSESGVPDADTSNQIQNVIVTPYHDRIYVSWDRLPDHKEYKVVVTDVAASQKITVLRTINTGSQFNLDPDTEYRIAVSAFADKSTKVVVKVTTPAAPDTEPQDTEQPIPRIPPIPTNST